MTTIKENVIKFKIKKGLWRGYNLYDFLKLNKTPDLAQNFLNMQEEKE